MENKVKLIIKANNADMGSVSINKMPENHDVTIPDNNVCEVDKDSLVYLEAIEKQGYRFVIWSDGVSSKMRTVRASGNSEYVAIFSSEESNIISLMFNQLLYDGHRQTFSTPVCPDLCDFNDTNTTQSIMNTHSNNLTYESGAETKSSKYLVFLAWLLPLFAVIALFAVLFWPLKGSAEGLDSIVSIHLKGTDIPILVSSTCKDKGFFYAHKISIDTIYYKEINNLTSSNKPNTVVTRGEIKYRYTGWHKWLYSLIAAFLLSVALVFITKLIIQYLGKIRTCENNMQELRYRDAMKIANDNREFERIYYKTKVLLYEKREKMKIDEWVRDNEHNRKMATMEQERIAELNNVLRELAKIKNTITIKTPKNDGREMIIEKSILSDYCGSELQDIIKAFLMNNE